MPALWVLTEICYGLRSIYTLHVEVVKAKGDGLRPILVFTEMFPSRKGNWEREKWSFVRFHQNTLGNLKISVQNYKSVIVLTVFKYSYFLRFFTHKGFHVCYCLDNLLFLIFFLLWLLLMCVSYLCILSGHWYMFAMCLITLLLDASAVNLNIANCPFILCTTTALLVAMHALYFQKFITNFWAKKNYFKIKHKNQQSRIKILNDIWQCHLACRVIQRWYPLYNARLLKHLKLLLLLSLL